MLVQVKVKRYTVEYAWITVEHAEDTNAAKTIALQEANKNATIFQLSETHLSVDDVGDSYPDINEE